MNEHDRKLSLEIKDNLIYYKLRHIPTGLFYRPTDYRKKSNLSKSGKIFIVKPELTLREGPYSFYKNLNFIKLPIILDEWQIISYKVKIQSIEDIPKEVLKSTNERKRSTSNSTINNSQKSILENLKNTIKSKTK
jgi:hypothetical protein